MSASAATLVAPVHPTEDDIRVARRASSRLHEIGAQDGKPRLSLGAGAESDLPPAVVEMLTAILDELAQGHAVALAPLEREVTTQQAAEVLNVSRPHVIKLLEAGAMPFRKVGTHRRIRLADVMDYKARMDAQANQAFQALVDQAQELGMGYD
jgi:excisionase family DNA binding protein